MKTMKRMAALLLALCILLGMPFAVSANDASNGAPVLVRAMRIPKTAAGRLVGTNSANYADRAFALYFNGVVTFDSNSVKVRVLGYDVKGNIVMLGEGQGTANLGADLNTNLKNSNPIVYQLASTRSFGWMEQYDTNGAIDHFSVVIYDSSTDYEDGEIEGITLNGVTLKTTKKFNRDGGNRDAVFMTLDAAEDNLVMNSFEILDDTHMHVGFSEAVSIRLNADNSMMTPNQLSVGIYKWKSNDDYEAVKSSGSNLDGTIGSGTAYRYTVDGIEMDSDNKGFVVNFKDEAKLPRLVKALQTIRSNDPDGNYYLTFNFDEKARDAALGEVSDNYYIDAVRGLESNRPLYVNCYAKNMAHVKLDLAQASSAVRLDDSRIKLTMSSAVQLRSGAAITVNGEAVTVTAVQDTNDAENIAVAKEWLLTMPESSQALPEVSTVAVGEKAFFDAKTSSVNTYVAMIGDAKYESIEAALAAATNSQTVTLCTDITVGELNVPIGATLDLNGFELVAETVSSFGNVIDTKDGQGGIKIAKNEADDNNLILIANNGMLPLYDEGFAGYRFFNCTLEHKGREKDGDYQFGYIMKMSDDAFALLADSDADITLEYDITVQVDDKEPITLLRKFSAAIMTEYAEKQLQDDGNTYAAVLRVTGFEQVTTQVVTLTSTNPKVVSSTGVVMAAVDATVTYTYQNA